MRPRTTPKPARGDDYQCPVSVSTGPNRVTWYRWPEDPTRHGVCIPGDRRLHLFVWHRNDAGDLRAFTWCARDESGALALDMGNRLRCLGIARRMPPCSLGAALTSLPRPVLANLLEAAGCPTTAPAPAAWLLPKRAQPEPPPSALFTQLDLFGRGAA